MKTLKEMLGEARQVIPEQPPAELKKRLEAGEPVVVIDVRDPDEYRDGSIEGANNISRGFLEFRVGTAAPEPTTPIVLYCQTGLRSMLAAKALHDLGYTNVVNLQGGFQRWAQSGLPVVKDTPLGGEQIQRYSRHFLLPQVGEKGQRKLLRSKVLLIGAGGLGSPTALYLAAAGVGTLGLMDGDVVDVSNLQRQVLHTTANVGRPKVDSGAEMLHALNPDVNVIKLPTRIDVDNVMDIIKDYDWSWTGRTTSTPAILSTTPARSRARPMSTARSSSSRAWPRSSRPDKAPATAVSIRLRRRRASYPPEARPASWACSQA